MEKPTKLDRNDITTLSHHLYILCHFANYAQHKTLYMHLAYSYALNEQGTQHWSLQSSIDPYLPCSAAQHNSSILFMHSTVSASGKVDHTCHAQYSNYILHCSHPQHNSLPIHINTPHCLPQPSSAHNKHKS